MKNTKMENTVIPSLVNFQALVSVAQKIYNANPANAEKHFMNISDKEIQYFLLALNDHEVKYMLVGGFATIFYGHVRTTQDLDFWIKDTVENKKRLIGALKQVEVPGADDYLNVEMIPGWSTVAIGKKGFTADMMGYLKRFGKEEFDICYKRSKKGTYDGVSFRVIHLNDLIEEKRSTARPKDLEDVNQLLRIQRGQ